MEIMVNSVASQLIAKRAKNTIAVSVYATSVLFSMHDVLEEVAKTPGLAAEDVVEFNGLASIIRAIKEALEAAKLEDRGRK